MWFYKGGSCSTRASVFSAVTSQKQQTQPEFHVAANQVSVVRETLKPELTLKTSNEYYINVIVISYFFVIPVQPSLLTTSDAFLLKLIIKLITFLTPVGPQ